MNPFPRWHAGAPTGPGGPVAPVAAGWEQLDELQRRLYRTIVGERPQSGALAEAAASGGPLPGPFGPMLLDPPVGDAVQRLGAVLRQRGVLNAGLRETAIVACAVACGSAYELRAHVPLALASGVDPGDVDDLVAGGPGPADHASACVVGSVQALVRDGALSPPAVEALTDAVGDAGAFELVVLVGYYRMLASILATYGVD